MNARIPLTLLLVAAAAAVPVAQAASTRDTYVRRSFVAVAPVEGKPDRRARIEAKVVLPAAWRVIGRSSSRLRVLAGSDACLFTIEFRARMVRGPAGAAQARAEERLPGTGRYVLDSGARGAGAWRVVRERSSDGAAAMRAIRVDRTAWLWREITATATPRPNDECHSGVYRESIGPTIGDVMATARSRWDVT